MQTPHNLSFLHEYIMFLFIYLIILGIPIRSVVLLSGLVSSVRTAFASKLRGPGLKSWPGTVGGPVTIIMWGAQPGWKLALS